MRTEISFQTDSVTAGVLFDQYEYRDGLETLATLYVQHGVMVDDGPVILSNHLQTFGDGVRRRDRKPAFDRGRLYR